MKTIDDIVRWRLCLGCGVCQSVCQKENIVLKDIIDEGIRPVRRNVDCLLCSECVQVCPGWKYPLLQHGQQGESSGGHTIHPLFGPYLELWEGNAVDPEIRKKGSSGGVLTALGVACLSAKQTDRIIHIGANEKFPYRNKTFISRSREDLIKGTSSRYSPASPGDSLRFLPDDNKSYAFIGKPCDVAGLIKARRLKPKIDKKVELTFALFCAGTPSTRGTLDLLESRGMSSEELENLVFRGAGWPGNFLASSAVNQGKTIDLSYIDSWGLLQSYRPYRCYLCPDSTGEMADISCGDPWYRAGDGDDLGKSLIIIRTEPGREILRKALAEKHLEASSVEVDAVLESQKNLFNKRKELWGRIAAMKCFLIPSPAYYGFPLRENWKRLDQGKKTRVFLGTVKRIFKKSYFVPMKRKIL